jgi:hypothetical protein
MKRKRGRGSSAGDLEKAHLVGWGAHNVVRKGWTGGQIFVGLDKMGWRLSYDRCSEYFVD